MSNVKIKGKLALNTIFDDAKKAADERPDFTLISEDGIVKLHDVERKTDRNGVPYINLTFRNDAGEKLKSPQYVGGQEISLEKFERQLDFHFRILWGFGGAISSDVELDSAVPIKDQLDKVARALESGYKGAIGQLGMIKLEDDIKVKDGKERKYKRLAYVSAVEEEV